jgi:hypothetical protein
MKRSFAGICVGWIKHIRNGEDTQFAEVIGLTYISVTFRLKHSFNHSNIVLADHIITAAIRQPLDMVQLDKHVDWT